MQEKVLVLDIDGTLTNSKKEITEATKQGIWNILQHGHKVILASGRPTPGMRKCEEELELKKYGGDRKSTRLNSSHSGQSRMPSSA